LKDLKKYLLIPGPPEDVYRALTIPLSIQLWTGEPAEMSTEPGSEFSLYNGNITGTNVSFEENRCIVQQWSFGDQVEPSMVTYLLHPHKKGTSLEIRHTNIPSDVFEEFDQGWENDLLADLLEFFEE
jgi:uncharacterized protein YndB with AHSA1/START domain